MPVSGQYFAYPLYLMVHLVLKLPGRSKNQLVSALEILPLCLPHLGDQVKKLSTCHSVSVKFAWVKFHVLGKVPGEDDFVLLAADDGGRGC